MLSNVFTYGSLTFPEVWERVVRRSVDRRKASLRNHFRFTVVDEIYPGMIARTGSHVQGVVYLGVSAEDIACLDAFEGDAYRRISTPVALEDGNVVDAWTYLFIAQHRLSAQPWEPENFQLQHFLNIYCRDG